ncbi:V-type ATP synthase subunit D [Patescibacteria group bacterium]|nr:V-type ATP synthase subunit D [Patescibacteria group bacterium]MBU1890888.1 V-type ATP synthase subunit D [Patescibacteria group bacterium]
MAQKINPTRMELIRLKNKLKVARRGHKLLKEKRDGLMKDFMQIVRQARDLRAKVEASMSDGFKSFVFAAADMRPEVTEEALAVPSKKIKLDVKTKNVMSVMVPQFDYQEEGDFVSYSLSTTAAGLDKSLKIFSDSMANIVQLAQIEHSARLLSIEIEKTRRRVNALEYVFVPEMERNIKYISSKLDEQERSAITGLMTIKETME